MRLTKRLMSGRFTLTDMYAQMEMMSKIGTLDKVLSHLPDAMFGGMGNMGVAQKKQMQSNLDKYRIVMDSMTQEEKDDPLLLKSSRIGGSLEVLDVRKERSRNSLLNGTGARR